jgi:ADP-heptose:LPS heptosyltransferase
MTPPQRIGLFGLGGMGDMFKWYCLQGTQRGWGYLQSLKEKYPNTQTMALVCSTNPHAVDIFTHNPYIDIVKYHAWPINNKGNLLLPGQLRLEQVLKKKGYPLMSIPKMQQLGLKPKKCVIYLDEKDNKEFKKVIGKIGPYIVLHPFASVAERQVVDLKQYNQLIDQLVQKFNCSVIILGKSYQRSFSSQNKLTSYNKEETIQTINPQALNLVNQTNTRVAIKIVQGAIGFIGVHSCFSCIAASEQIQTVVLSNNKNCKIAQQTMRSWWTKNNNFSIINVNKQPWDETVNQSCSYLQGYFKC